MLIKRLIRSCCFVALILIVAGCSIPIPTIQPLTKIDTVEEIQTAQLDGAARAVVHLRLLSEELEVRPAAGADFFRGLFRYNVKEWSPNITREATDGVLDLTVNQGLGSQIPIGLGDEYDNIWEVELAPGVPLDLSVDMGSGVADLDLSGLSITKLTLTTGKTDVAIAFHQPNPEPLSMLRLTAGAGNTYITGLGNANIDQLNIIGGTGAIDLDFDGLLTRSALVDIKSGAGEFDIRVPDAIGVRVTFIATPISTIATSGFTESAENVYVNDAYGQAAVTLTIKITAGIGKVALVSQ